MHSTLVHKMHAFTSILRDDMSIRVNIELAQFFIFFLIYFMFNVIIYAVKRNSFSFFIYYSASTCPSEFLPETKACWCGSKTLSREAPCCLQLFSA